MAERIDAKRVGRELRGEVGLAAARCSRFVFAAQPPRHAHPRATCFIRDRACRLRLASTSIARAIPVARGESTEGPERP